MPGPRTAILSTLAALTPFATAARADEHPSDAERRVRAQVTSLADDLTEDRGPSTRGHVLAMNYIAAQFVRLGIEAVGEPGYQQPMAVRESRLDLAACKLVIHHADNVVALAPINAMIA